MQTNKWKWEYEQDWKIPQILLQRGRRRRDDGWRRKDVMIFDRKRERSFFHPLRRFSSSAVTEFTWIFLVCRHGNSWLLRVTAVAFNVVVCARTWTMLHAVLCLSLAAAVVVTASPPTTEGKNLRFVGRFTCTLLVKEMWKNKMITFLKKNNRTYFGFTYQYLWVPS